MITTIVKYRSARQLSREEVGKMMEYGARERFLGLPHLHSKQFCFNVETGEGLSVYLWDSRESADAFFSEDFLKEFEKSMGSRPTVEHHETIVLVDNRKGDVFVGD